jgi:hypothetical protein
MVIYSRERHKPKTCAPGGELVEVHCEACKVFSRAIITPFQAASNLADFRELAYQECDRKLTEVGCTHGDSQ